MGRGLFPMGQMKGGIKSLDCSKPLNSYLSKAGLSGEIEVLQSMQIAISFVNLYEPQSRHFVLPNSSISRRYLSISFPHFCQYSWSMSKLSFILNSQSITKYITNVIYLKIRKLQVFSQQQKSHFF